ncbi:unnamed protein product [Prorocentrum cordatum]|uniref:Uncharacterized protein n=1 Tax=Prorocentrum cordatum TaxID=2364126 RepID=A0ABN9U4X0_9DINO|nr:unnamed protein product [Polarella glacialis]
MAPAAHSSSAGRLRSEGGGVDCLVEEASKPGVNALPELSTARTSCPDCRGPLQPVQQRSPVRCVIVAEPQCVARHHFAKQCVPCSAAGAVRKYWCGYVETSAPERQGAFVKSMDISAPANPFFMLNKSFGIDSAWAKRWGYRLYAHRASFSGEAQILRALEPDVPIETLERGLESAWIRYQLWQRAAESAPSTKKVLASSLLEKTLEDLLRENMGWYKPMMAERRLQAWRSSGDRLDICAMDGNAKLCRRTCGAPCAEAVYSDELGMHLVRGCPDTPLQKGVLCRRHQELAAVPSQTGIGTHIEAHRVLAPLATVAFLDVEVRLAGSDRFQPACTVDNDLVQSYFARNAEVVLQERKRRRQERRDLRVGRAPAFCLGDWASREPKDKCSCKTHKESISAVRTSARSAGILTAVSETGVIGAFEEVITAETLSQRYCFLAKVAAAVPELKTLVHDDACHVRVFALCRGADAAEGSMAARLGGFQFILDRPHSLGHVDPTCRNECFPTVAANEATLGSFPTPICESVNAQLSPLAHTVHHMGRWVCSFLVSELVEVHNMFRDVGAARESARAQRRAQKKARRPPPPAALPAEVPEAAPAVEAAVGDGAGGDSAAHVVRRRKLRQFWADAAAAGDKFFECQAYQERSPRNQLGFACAGARIVFGSTLVAGVAVCAATAQRDVNADDTKRLLKQVPEHLRGALAEFLAPSSSFDVVHMDVIFDLRPLGLTWETLHEALGARPLKQNCGWPRLQGENVSNRLDELCQRPGVIVRRPPPPALG